MDFILENWPTVALVLVLTVVALPYVLNILASGSGSSLGSSGDAVLFTGPQAAGKTVLVHKLWKDTAQDTVTSMQPLDRTVPLAAAGGSTARVIDFPGHPRLRGQLGDYLKAAKKIVFVVDAAGNDAHLTAAAELMFDLLTSPAVATAQPPLLLLGAQLDKQGARPMATLKTDLQAAVTAVKESRASMLATGESDVAGVLGRKGAPFTFDGDAPTAVQLGALSAHTGAGMPALVDFITS